MKNQNRFLVLAKEFVNTYISEFNGKILGALLVGSASFGIHDKFTDVDIFVYVSDDVVKKRKAQGYNETYPFKGVEICVDWNSIEKLEEILSAWKDDESLWVFYNAKILYDPKGLMQKLLKRIKRYPKELRRKKIFLHFYYLKAFLEDCKKAILRSDFLTALFLIYKAIDEITYLSFILEGLYVPYPKWRLHLIKKLPLGTKILPKIEKILCIKGLDKTELTIKLKDLNDIVEDLKPNFCEAGIPEKWLGSNWWMYEPDWDA